MRKLHPDALIERKKFEEHVKKAGVEAVQKVLPAPGATNEAGKAEDSEYDLAIRTSSPDLPSVPIDIECGWTYLRLCPHSARAGTRRS
jgi:hypothetical protein